MKKLPIQIPILKSVRKSKLPVSLRTDKDEKAYSRAKKAKTSRPLHKEPRIKEWQYWALIDNEYPYSVAFKTHHMLIPKRKVAQQNLSKQERTELDNILAELNADYDCLQINFVRNQSVRDHFHIHLLEFKTKRKELRF